MVSQLGCKIGKTTERKRDTGMRVPLSWLQDFVEVTLPVNDLVHRLTMAGLEVGDVDVYRGRLAAG